MRIGEVLEAWRFYEKMTVKQAAERLGMHWDTYRRLEKGGDMQGETLALVLKWLLSDG